MFACRRRALIDPEPTYAPLGSGHSNRSERLSQLSNAVATALSGPFIIESHRPRAAAAIAES